MLTSPRVGTVCRRKGQWVRKFRLRIRSPFRSALQVLHAPSSLSSLPAHHMDTKAPELCFLGPLMGDPASELAAVATGGLGTDWVERAVSLLPATTAGEDPSPFGPRPCSPVQRAVPPPSVPCLTPLTLSAHSRRGLCTHSNQAQEDTDAQEEPSLHSLAQLPQLIPIHELHLMGLPLGSQCPDTLSSQNQAWAPWALPTKVLSGEVAEAHGTHRGPPGMGFQ